MKRCSMPGCALHVPKKPIRGHKLTHLCREHFEFDTRNPFQNRPRQEKIEVGIWDGGSFAESLKQEYNFTRTRFNLE